MEKIKVWITSPASWGIIAFFILGGLQQIEPQLSGTALTIVKDAILLLGLFLHPTNIIAGKSVTPFNKG